jgi:hypothetical protein
MDMEGDTIHNDTRVLSKGEWVTLREIRTANISQVTVLSGLQVEDIESSLNGPWKPKSGHRDATRT